MGDGSPVVILSKPAIQRDGTTFDSDAYNDGQHVRFDRGRPRKMWGIRVISESLSEPSRGMSSFTRAGSVYIHTGGEAALESATFQYNGFGASVVDRTPDIYVSDALNSWTLDTISDPTTNAAMVVAHAAPNLEYIDNNVELPIYWGAMSGSSALVPLGLPITNTATTVTSVTGDTTNASATVANVSDVSDLAYGYTVTGSGIPANTYIAAVGASTITLSQNATATAAGVTLTITTGGVSGGVVALYPYLMAYSSDGSVQWTTPLAKGETPADFWGDGSGQAFITGQKIVRGMRLRGGPGYSPAGLFWSLDSLIRATFVGGDAIFSFDTISDTISILSPRSVVEIDGIYYWAGVDRFFMFGGTVRELPNNRNLSWFFDGMNQNEKQKCFAFAVPRWGEVWFCYPRGDATECTHAAIYNWRINDWYDTRLLNGGRSAGVSSNVYPYPLLIGVDPSPFLWQHEYGVDESRGTMTLAIQSYFQTADYSLLLGEKPQDKGLRVVRLEPDCVQSGDMSVKIIGQANAKAPVQTGDALPIYADPPSARESVVLFQKAARRLMSFRIESNTVGGDYYFGKSLGFIEPTDATYTGS